MSNKLVKRKLPYADDFTDLKDAFNYMVKELNGSFVNIPEVSESTEEVFQGIMGELKTVSFVHPGGPTTIVSVTVAHTLQTTPVGVSYCGQVNAIDIYDGNPIVWRVASMTSTNVTIEMRIVSGTKTHKFLVFK